MNGFVITLAAGIWGCSDRSVVQSSERNQPDCQRIRLTVHRANEAGVKFYNTLGFTDDHVLTYGEPTFSLYLQGENT